MNTNEYDDESDDIEVENDIRKLKEFGLELKDLCNFSPVLKREELLHEEEEEEEEGRDLLTFISRDIAAAASTKNNSIVINRIILHFLRKLESQVTTALETNQLKQRMLTKQLKDLQEESNFLQSPIHCSACVVKCGMPFFTLPGNLVQPNSQNRIQLMEAGSAMPELHFRPSLCWSQFDNEALSKAMEEFVTDDLNNWNKVSEKIGGHYSPEECMAQWHYSLKPGINRSRWKSDDVRRLSEIALRENYQGWDKIAEKLGTGHSGLQCCIRFQRSSVSISDQWSHEEDELLKILVPLFFKTSRPISRLQYFFDDKNSIHIVKRCKDLRLIHFKSVNVSKKLHHKLIRLLPDKYASADVANTVNRYLPLSTWRTLKERLSADLERHISFSSEEDRLLLQAVRSHGKDWSLVAEAVPGRQPFEVSIRYKSLVMATDVSVVKNTIFLEHLGDDDIALGPHFENILKQISQRGQKALGLLPVSRGGDVWPILQMFWETRPDDKPIERYGIKFGKSMSFYCHQLLRLLEMGRSNLFGPRYRAPHDDSQRALFCSQMVVVARALSTAFSPSVVASRILCVKNFGSPENTLIPLLNEEHGTGTSGKKGQYFVPPNFSTLMGARVLTWAKGLLIGQANLPIEHRRTTMDPSVAPEDRLSFDAAKKLLAERMFSLFFMSLCMGELQGSPTQSVASDTHRQCKIVNKPLTKLKRKQKAQKLNEQRWKKKEENVDGPPPPKKAKMIRTSSCIVDKTPWKNRKSQSLKVETIKVEELN